MVHGRMELMRLQKWLSQLGVASRREAETWITEGRLAINGKPVEKLGVKIDPEKDSVTLNGKQLSNKLPPRIYWMLNKPDKVLTTRKDTRGRETIYSLPALRRTPFLYSPVGRLDYRTEGMLLLSNDGELVHRLMHPKYKLPRTYSVLIEGKLDDKSFEKIKKGIRLNDGLVNKIIVVPINRTTKGSKTSRWYRITVFEGRNRLVRRIFEKLRYPVKRLVRVGFGELSLPFNLEPGQYRQLTPQQVRSLKRAAHLDKK